MVFILILKQSPVMSTHSPHCLAYDCWEGKHWLCFTYVILFCPHLQHRRLRQMCASTGIQQTCDQWSLLSKTWMCWSNHTLLSKTWNGLWNWRETEAAKRTVKINSSFKMQDEYNYPQTKLNKSLQALIPPSLLPNREAWVSIQWVITSSLRSLEHRKYMGGVSNENVVDRMRSVFK